MQSCGGKRATSMLHYDTDDNLTFQKANTMGFSIQKGEREEMSAQQKKKQFKP
jgi:hypothetical protein